MTPQGKYAVGDNVEVQTEHGGAFTGKIVEFAPGGQVMHIVPNSEDLRTYLGGKTYKLGRAHWDAKLKRVL